MKDGVKIHAMSKRGLRIESCRLFWMPKYERIPHLRTSQAGTRRNDLLLKFKTRIALRNGILFWVIFIPTAIVELAGIFGLFFITLDRISVFLGYSFGASSGIVCAMVVIVAWLFTYDKLNQHFETDPYYIKR